MMIISFTCGLTVNLVNNFHDHQVPFMNGPIRSMICEVAINALNYAIIHYLRHENGFGGNDSATIYLKFHASIFEEEMFIAQQANFPIVAIGAMN